MKHIPSDFDPVIVDAIDGRLDTIVAGGIAIPLAVESGSRAWGFASPDSDYDCRFLYVRPTSDYLSLWQERDVIETPLEGLLDVSGWDVGKAIRLVVKGNAVVSEWLRSPIIYRGDPVFRDRLAEFADRHAPLALVRRHYRSLAAQHRISSSGTIAIKKLFYALRPAAALRWMRIMPDRLPPMHFPTLLAECSLPADLAALIAELMAAKAITRELGRAEMPPTIAAFVDDEISRSEVQADERSDDRVARAAADELFRDLIADFGLPR